jgi:hypothetical protein
MTPTEQFTDVMYANRVFGAIEVRQHTRQLAAELGIPESVLGAPPIPAPPVPSPITVVRDIDWDREVGEMRASWTHGLLIDDRVAIGLPDGHSHLPLGSPA